MSEREELLREKERLEEKVRLQEQEIKRLTEKVNLLVARIFGAKSEKLDPSQLFLGLEDARGEPEASPAEATAEEAVNISQPRKSRRPRLPEHLPVEERVLIPPEVQEAPEAWRQIGEEISEQLDYEPGRFLRKRTVRPTYVNRDRPEEAPITAELPERLIAKGMYAPGLLAQIVIGKYADHLPLDRQEKIFKQRYGVEIPRQSMSRALEGVADGLQLIVEEMKRQQFATGAVQVDETPVKYLCPGEGKTRTGYFWTTNVPATAGKPGGDTVYHWEPGRGSACLDRIVPESFVGVLQTDGYQAYKTFQNRRKGIELAGCWAHARRYVLQAYEQRESLTRSGWLLRQIQLLYEIEGRCRESRAGPRLRGAIRQSKSRMVLNRIDKALTLFQRGNRHPPKSLMGQALTYLRGQWTSLAYPFGDGRLEIDNNLVENAIRPTAVGKKNWLFIGGELAGRKSAILYSLITSCRNHGVEPYAYLKYVIETVPMLTNLQIPGVTPAAYAKRFLRKAS